MTQMRETTELRKLHPAIEKVWKYGALTTGLTGFGVFLGIGLLIGKIAKFHLLISGPAAGVIGFIFFALVPFLSAKRQYEEYRYQLREFDVLIKKGIIWKSERYIARDRIQHIDINSGPFDRKFGLVQVVIYSAGISGSVGLIPGLTPAEGEWLKEQLILSRAEEA